MTQWTAPYNTMLLNVDLTNDFLPQGTLAVTNGEHVIPIVNALRSHFAHVGWTKEEHDAQHAFFASSHPDKKPLDTVETPYGTQYLWPDHCITGTIGAAFHPDLIVEPQDLVVIKGTDPTVHAYSAVRMDDRATEIRYPDDNLTLPEKLRQLNINQVVVTGLAYDFCVGMTAYDLAKDGFDVVVLRDASKPIAIPVDNNRTTENLMDEMLAEAGVIVTTSDALPQLFNTSRQQLHL
jgi:nicotinamidase/pyrazinamidase